MDIGQRIKTTRERKSISMNALSKKSGAAQSAISEIESGKRQPTFEVLEKIITGLGYTLSEFFADQSPELSPEVRQIVEKVQKLPPDKIKVLNAVLNSWVESDSQKRE